VKKNKRKHVKMYLGAYNIRMKNDVKRRY